MLLSKRKWTVSPLLTFNITGIKHTLEETGKHEVLPDPSLGLENGAQASWIPESAVVTETQPRPLSIFLGPSSN